MSKLLIGSISYCPPDKEKQSLRAHAHKAQLDWLRDLHIEEVSEYEYIRVEQAYTEEFAAHVMPELPCTSIKFDKGLGPSAARNILLQRLYESDSDWLICMDDDRKLYSHYNGSDFIRECAVNPDLIALAKEGVLVTCVSPWMSPFKERNADFGKVATHWNLIRTTLDGCLQICAIPNLVKYGHKAIWFNEKNTAGFDEIPEDREFQFDWLMDKHPLALNAMMIMWEILPQTSNSSTIYVDQQLRLDIQATHASAIATYLRKRTKNRISTLREFNKRKNVFQPKAVPRLLPYTPVQSDYGKFKTI